MKFLLPYAPRLLKTRKKNRKILKNFKRISGDMVDRELPIKFSLVYAGVSVNELTDDGRLGNNAGRVPRHKCT